MASGNLYIEAQKLFDVPEKYKATSLALYFEMSNYEGATALTMPRIKEVNSKQTLCVEWPNTWEFELEDPEDFNDNMIDFEVKDGEGRVLGRASISTNHIEKTKPYEEDVVIKPHGADDFVGAKLQVAITYQTPPPLWPEHLQIRVEEGHGFYLNQNQLADESTQIYVAISHNERVLGTTRPLPGPNPKWMDYIAEPKYEHEPWIMLTAYGTHLGEKILIGSCRLNIWNVIDKAKPDEYEWMKHGDVHLVIDGKISEAPRGIVKMTVRFSNDRPDEPIRIREAPAPGLTAPPAATIQVDDAPADRAIDDLAKPNAAAPLSDAEDDVLTPAEAKDKAKEARRLADQAEDAARAADNAAADADIVSRSNPSKEIDELANDADSAAKKARKAADKANAIADEVEDAVRKPKVRANAVYKLMDTLKDKTNDALDECDRAEEDAKAALRLNADDLAAKAKDHYTKTADYAGQTEKLASELDDVPKIRNLAYGAKEDQSSAMLAAQDARAEAKACRDAKKVADAYAAMKECEAMVKDAKKCEDDAHEKWRKANKLAQKRRKEQDEAQQEEWKRRQEEAAADALKKQKERQNNHKQDKMQRQRSNNNDAENDAYQLALMNMNGARAPPRYNRGGIFKNCCWEPARTNPSLMSPSKNGRSASLASEGSYGHHKLQNVKLNELVVRQNPDADNERAASTTMARNDEAVYGFDGGSMTETNVDGRRVKAYSNSRDYQANRYELVETQYPYHTRKTPWCWCFGCQCCHCCGEC